MRLTELRIDRLRCIDRLELGVGPGWTAFVGANGAGKTSILEALFLLSHGRSFRGAARDALTQIGSAGFSVFGRVQRADGAERRLGLSRSAGRLDARLDGESVSLATLVEASAVVCFEPGSHELINGAADERRRFVDWGVFHVEHDFLIAWRRYQRALRQRNVLLRDLDALEALQPWEREMADTGERLSAQRAAYLRRLQPFLETVIADFLPELGQPVLAFDRGWRDGIDLGEALLEARGRDRDRGHTSRGPHRADWSIGFALAPRREHLSRGQQKLCALAFLLAQAQLYAADCGDWPILCFDDLASELDPAHQERVIQVAESSMAQVVLTGTELPKPLVGRAMALAVFHVEPAGFANGCYNAWWIFTSAALRCARRSRPPESHDDQHEQYDSRKSRS